MSNQTAILRVRDIIESPFAVAVADGQLVYDAIRPALHEGRPVRLSFEGVTVILGVFLNAAVGQCVADFDESELSELLTVSDIDGNAEAIFHATLRNARAYHANPEAYGAAWAEEMSEVC